MTKEKERLAYEIATALNDLESLSLHRRFVEQYSEEHLRKILNKVMAVPEAKIRVSRGAYFNNLVRNERTSNYSRY